MIRLRLLAALLVLAVAVAAAAATTTHDYYVNRRAQDDGDHEVHREDCRWLPQPQNRIPLGAFADCHGALRAAREHYASADGCRHCATACDTD